MAIKIDMEKAFDHMEWSFILAILSKLGFHPTWISWVRICISSQTFSILINEALLVNLLQREDFVKETHYPLFSLFWELKFYVVFLSVKNLKIFSKESK